MHRSGFIVRARGAERHFSSSAAPILTRGGEAAGAAMVLRDVSDEHQYAEMLRHTNRELRRQADVLEEVNQQLRDATKAKDQFLAVMSHELRTPINAIMGYSDLLDLEVKGPLNNEQKTMVTRVRETSRHLLGLINEVLDLAKIGSGRIDLVTAELDPGMVIDRAVQQVMPLAIGKGLKLTVKQPDAPVTALADETRLAQIVLNLLSNAVKFTTQGGVTVSYARHLDRVQIRVRDTGPGIGAEQRERIFEEFYQVESGLSRTIGGTGLGLAIARRFARLMNGDIRVESEPGSGAEFVVELPAGGVKPQARSGAEPLVAVLAEGQEIAFLARELRGGARILGSPDPEQLAAMGSSELPALAVVDGAADRARGWRAVSALAGEPLTAGLPILLTARGPWEDAGVDGLDRVVDLGLLWTLTSPVSAGHAARAVSRAAMGRRLSSVVIAADDVEVRRTLEETLSALGCAVRTAADGAQALAALDAALPTVVIVELLLGGADGIALLAKLRSDESLRRLPAVGLVPAEPSAADLTGLAAACRAVVREPSARRESLPQLIREAAGLDQREEAERATA